jgi:hypothetical protein
MEKILITYADEKMLTSGHLCIFSAEEKGDIHKCHMYRSSFIFHLDEQFYYRHYSTLNTECRGGGKGFWLWKPFLCEYTARTQELGTYVIYADAGIEFIASIDPIIGQMERDSEQIFLFGNEHRHTKYTKAKVLRHMIPFPCPGVRQVQASVIIFKVTEATRRLMAEWLAWSTIPGFIDDSDNVGVEYESEYSDHRNDQSILSCIAIMHGIPLHWWPAQYGKYIKHEYPDDHYGQLFYHHRYRESDWEKCGLTIEQFMQQPKNI